MVDSYQSGYADGVAFAPRAFFVMALLAASCGCERGTCPAPYQRDEARSDGIRQVLRRDPEGAALLERAGSQLVCWGEPDEAVLDERGHLLMDRRTSDAEAAARLGHLLQHVSEGVPLSEGCAGLALAEQRERKAHALEARLRQAFGAPPANPAALEGVLAGYRARCAAR